MTDEEKDRLIAEEVMGWYDDKAGTGLSQLNGQAGYRDNNGKFQMLVDEHAPTTNTDQAVHALEAYAALPQRCYDLSNDLVVICHKDNAGCWRTLARVERDNNKSLSAAIVDALIQATKETD